MDVNWYKVFYIYIIIILEFNITSSSDLDVELKTVDENNVCVRKLQSCKFTLDGQVLGEPGPKGDKGDIGLPGTGGIPGTNGEKGVQGHFGEMGPKGMKGDTGAEGEKGDLGLTGPKGEKGDPGPVGLGVKGERGEQGKIGYSGKDGMPGPNGPPGLNGLPGTCGCKVYEPNDNDYSLEGTDLTELKFATKDQPANVMCKAFPDFALRKSGTHYVGVKPQPIEIYCNQTTKETCLQSKTFSKQIFYTGMDQDIKETTITYKSKQGAFWMSSIADLLDMYNLTTEQITWLQKRSSSVRQTIRYHCMNSVPYSSSNISSSVHLLSWNDLAIGPYPSAAVPVNYNVPEISSHCVKGSTTEQYTDIVLRSINVNRLPIRDILIGDVREELQMFYIENLLLCFV